MTKHHLYYDVVPVRSTRSPGQSFKELLRQSLFSAQDTSLETTAAHVTLWLERGECVSLKAGRPFQLECSEGEAWVTVEGDARDYRLTPRAGVSIPGGARVVAQALADSRIAIQSQRQI